MPWYWYPERCSTASRIVLLGIVPVLIHVPPTMARCSITATWRPNFAPWMAARWPAGPEPMTIKSYFCMCTGARPSGSPGNPRPLLRRVEPLFDLVPVYNVPPCRDIVRPAVLVFQVVGVLPDIQSEDHRFAFGNGAVLVGGGQNVDLPAGTNQPRPPRTEARSGGLVELLLERRKASERPVDRLRQVAHRSATTARRHDPPEQGVVVVAASVVAHRRTNGFRNDGQVVRQQFLNRLAGQLRSRFQGLVQVIHVGGVVLAVVNLHGQLVDVRLQGLG